MSDDNTKKSEASNSRVAVIVTLITVVGGIIVSIINNYKGHSDQNNSPSTKIVDAKTAKELTPSPQGSNAPNFSELSTFCDTLNYFIDQNNHDYNWLQGDEVSVVDRTTVFESKLKLLNYATTIEQDPSGYDTYVLVLKTADINEAEKIYQILVNRFIACLSRFRVKHLDETADDKLKLRVISTEFRKDHDLITIQLNIPEKKDFATVDLYVEKDSSK